MSEKIKLLCNIIPKNSADKYFITIALYKLSMGLDYKNGSKNSF